MTRILQPALASDGGGVNSLTDLALPYGTNETGDLFRAVISCLGVQVPTPPAGFTLVDSHAAGGLAVFIYDRDTRSTGTEVGSETFTIPAGNFPNQGVILAYRNVRIANYGESLVNASAAGAGPTSIAGPTVIAGGNARLACLYSFTNAQGVHTVVTGQTGGVWIDRFVWDSGFGALLNIQDACLANAGTITGGTMSMPGTAITQIAQALIGASYSQTTGAFSLVVTGNQFQFATAALEGARVGDTFTWARLTSTGTVDTTSCVEVFCAVDDQITAKFITTEAGGFAGTEEWLLAIGLPDD